MSPIIFIDNLTAFALLILISLAVGSFLNVVIYRLPMRIKQELSEQGPNLAWPPSFCPHCKKRIRWFDNIPLFSFLFLRGHCRACGQKISFLYFFIELITPPFSIAIFFCFVFYFTILS